MTAWRAFRDVAISGLQIIFWSGVILLIAHADGCIDLYRLMGK